MRTFEQDVAFLSKHHDTLVLKDESGRAQVAVVPAWQGRIVTSTATGGDGVSCGWINYDLVESGEIQPHINVFGGEDRFWLGPEGGQYSIFFKGGDPFDLEHWQTPAPIDTEAFAVVSSSDDEVALRHSATLTNYSGARFDVGVDRTIRLLSPADVARQLGVVVDSDMRMVAFESENRLTNTGTRPWTRDDGLLSIWILGMFKHSPRTTVVAPFVAGPESQLGPVVNDAYFGKVPADRLVIGDGVLFFKGDGQMRSKIGIPPRRARPIAGSWDPTRNLLTIVQYTLPPGATDYVNSMWEHQEQPYAGDAFNSYNDGPPAPGAKPLGPFYELESSSPALALGPGQSATHVHRTYHFVADRERLDGIARQLLGVGLERIEAALGS